MRLLPKLGLIDAIGCTAASGHDIRRPLLMGEANSAGTSMATGKSGPGEVLLEWKNVTVDVSSSPSKLWPCRQQDPVAGATRYPLKNASGAVRSANLVAIMGASGAGKTTLLAAISMRLVATVTGKVLINGLYVTKTQMKQLTGFVPQYEIAIQSLTVAEHLRFMALLKGVSGRQTQKVINELNLHGCCGTRIRNLSGGERKKVNLAGELLNEPDVLFCDEPVTGLDSFSALSIMKTLQRLSVKSRKAIICTIHDPASEIFECFTDVILLKDGEILFQGPTAETTPFFASIGTVLPLNCNPADHYFALSVTHGDDSSEQSYRAEIIKRTYKENVAKKTLIARRQQKRIIDKLGSHRERPAGYLQQLSILLRRTAIDSIRNFREYVMVTSVFMVTSVAIAALYSQVQPTTQTSIQDIRGALFLMISELVYTVSYGVFYTFHKEMPLVRREVGEKCYKLSAYYIHKVLYTVPRAFFESFAFVGIIYATVSFTTGFATYCYMSLACAASALLAMSYGYLLSCMSGTMSMAIEASNIIFLAFMLLGGLYLNVRAFPILKYLSFFFFASEGVSIYYWLTVGEIDCELGTRNATCLRTGVAVLENYGYGTSYQTVHLNFLLLAIETCLVHWGAYCLLRKFVRKAGFY